MVSLIIDYPYLLWGFLLFFVIIRTILPLRSKYDFVNLKIKNTERMEWKSLRDHNMVLASFTIVAFAIILALPTGIDEDKKPSLFYFSLAIFSFVIGSYLFRFTTDRRIPYVGETLEYAGIISLAIGLIYLISPLLQDIVFDIIYTAFFIGIGIISAIDLYLNYGWFYPKLNE